MHFLQRIGQSILQKNNTYMSDKRTIKLHNKWKVKCKI
jgi:hypothetical protein